MEYYTCEDGLENCLYKTINLNEALEYYNTHENVKEVFQFTENDDIVGCICCKQDNIKYECILNNCVNCDECEHRSETCLCDISHNDEDCPLVEEKLGEQINEKYFD